MKVRSILSVSVADWPEYNAYCRRYGVTLIRSCPDRFVPELWLGGKPGPRVDGYIVTVERDIPDGVPILPLLTDAVVWFFRGFMAPSEALEIVRCCRLLKDPHMVVLWERGLITDHEMASHVLIDALAMADQPVSA